jgi:hypothetical protein
VSHDLLIQAIDSADPLIALPGCLGFLAPQLLSLRRDKILERFHDSPPNKSPFPNLFVWKSRHRGVNVKMTTSLPGADLGERER